VDQELEDQVASVVVSVLVRVAKRGLTVMLVQEEVLAAMSAVRLLVVA